MQMKIEIDRKSNVPIYRQIYSQICGLIEDGLLGVGTKIPSVRDLAKSFGVSITTVHAAYNALAAENLIETRQGSGTFVVNQDGLLSDVNLRTREEMGNEFDELPKMIWQPYEFNSRFFLVPPGARPANELIRFSLASPDPTLFPFKRIKQTITNMLWNPQELFFIPGHPQGHLPLVEHLEREMALAGVPMAEGENDIILTSGFQRALSVILHLLLRPGQKVAVESPTYSAILNLLLAERIDFVPIPIDEQGMNTEYLAGVLAQGEVRAVVTIPTFHNPTGIVMSTERRKHLIRLAARHRLPIIEDDWGRHLSYDSDPPPPLKSMDPGGYVIHIGTYSKCFLPGLRVGWITCPADLAGLLVLAKLGADQGDSFFLQALVHEFIVKGHFAKHLRKTGKEYQRRRNAICRALAEHLPPGCSFHRPAGGFSVWLNLPPEVRSLPLLSLAREIGVEFLPASFCMPDRQDAAALRLAFSRTPVPEIHTGIKLLCDLIQRTLDNPRLLDAGAKSYEDLNR